MPITPFLRDHDFEPEHIVAMSEAFTRACESLGLVDRTDAFTAIVASHIIEGARRGLRTAEALYLDAMQEFKRARKHDELQATAKTPA